MTRAPMSASSMVQYGPESTRVRSRRETPLNGPLRGMRLHSSEEQPEPCVSSENAQKGDQSEARDSEAGVVAHADRDVRAADARESRRAHGRGHRRGPRDCGAGPGVDLGWRRVAGVKSARG